jgi:hypothetical protein
MPLTPAISGSPLRQRLRNTMLPTHYTAAL